MGDEVESEMGTGESEELPESGTPSKPSTEDPAAELERLRKALKDTNRESAARRKRLEELEQAEKERQDAALSESEKLKKERDEAKQALEQARLEVRTTRIRNAVEMAAAKLNFHDVADAHALADLAGVEVDAEGKVTGVEDALKALAKSKPHLVKQEEKPSGSALPASPAKGDKGAVSKDQDQKRQTDLKRQIRQWM